ncbi:hypothetical protein Pmani_005443 [Petrolisthes manimaculis]|uniref:Peptidase S54 rhomboid domain-containing protein n=1 Tax=Petrolisthes manimaculis TaxID=1843537 RepID=A0AAE1QBP6_9EUCA|nr:hypothetical protein Pmani_005443 [Petrolisthes manimaculis]
MATSLEETPLQPIEWSTSTRRGEVLARSPDQLDWHEVWYRLDEGRGQVTLRGFDKRVNRTSNNSQAVQQARKLLEEAGAEDKGFLEYDEFKDYYIRLPAGSWQRAVLTRVALDIQDLPPPPVDEPVFRSWVELVDYVHRYPSQLNFNWDWCMPEDYSRARLLHFVYYRSELVHPQRVNEWLLTTKFADHLPNEAVIRLLEKAQSPVTQADANRDGFLEYGEFLRFVQSKSRGYMGSAALRRGALAVVPRRERTLQTRRYIEEYACWPPPLFMILFTLAEIIVFIFYAVDMGLPTTGSGPCPTYSPLVFNPRRRYEAWRYMTYALIHSGWVHLVNNLVVQLALGVLLELVHRWRVILVYLAGVAAGCLAHSLYTPYYFLAGASGGVYAVEYAHLGNLFLNWSEMEYPWLQLAVVGIIMVLDLSYAIWDTYTNPGSSTGHMAHLGGAMAGVLVGVVVLRNLRKEKWEGYCWWSSLVLFLALLILAVVLNAVLPVPDFFPENDWSSIAQDRTDWMYENGK